MTMEEKKGLPILPFKSDATWTAWLEKNHAKSKGVWIRIPKKATGLATVSYEEAIFCALCYGWIDGQRSGLDENSYLQKFSPRGPRSLWSKINRERIAALDKSGRMRPAGAAAVERARRNGQWDAAYDSPKNAVVDPEFQAALDKSKSAAAFFATLNSANRYAILWRLQTAKKPETRTRRIQVILAMLKKKEKIHP
jgi:uncharacterized protein YdeI (YjbR/CyaY-like superfamily)